MKVQIRKNVFETNSSSVHTIVISNDGIEKSKFKLDENGKLHISLDTYFGKDYTIYDTQEEKLKYLLSYAYDDSKMWYGFDKYNNDNDPYEIAMIKETITDYIEECTGVVIDNVLCHAYGEKGYFCDNHFDHQTSPQNGNRCVVDLFDADSIISFVFNKMVSLKTDCD